MKNYELFLRFISSKAILHLDLANQWKIRHCLSCSYYLWLSENLQSGAKVFLLELKSCTSTNHEDRPTNHENRPTNHDNRPTNHDNRPTNHGDLELKEVYYSVF